ncbi:unnamed protein product, partial [Rotaria magnacalcarata]
MMRSDSPTSGRFNSPAASGGLTICIPILVANLLIISDLPVPDKDLNKIRHDTVF